MTRDDKGMVFGGLMISAPLLTWLGMAWMRYDIERPIVRNLIKVAKHTPQDDFLIGAIVFGLFAGFLSAEWIVKRFENHFGGADYRRWLRGTQMVNHQSLINKTTEKTEQILVANTPFPTHLENLHLLMAGATGTGKTVTLSQIIETIVLRRDRLIVIDPDGKFLSKFYFPGDVILNPFDKRSASWSIFNELWEDYDFETYALSVVPRGLTKEAEEWNSYARLLFQAAAKKMVSVGNTDIYSLIKLLTVETDENLKAFLQDTEAEGLFVGADKALSSARFILSKHLAPHKYLKDDGEFSIRRWLNEDVGNLYITWRENMRESLKPLVSTWADILCTSILSMPEDENRRIWLLMDEMDSLEKLSSLESALTKGRKYGLRVIGCIHSIAQLERTYGEKDATVIRSCFRNLVVLGGSKADSKTAEELSKSLGDHEVERESPSESHGDKGSSQSVSVRNVPERVVMPSEIQGLPDLTGYLAFASDYPIARFKLKPRDYPKRCSAIEE